ncbi:MAG TPA: DNA polymerase I, partial [Sutterella sp.]|nr:DNA polymerase I [Sutterella sp.]
WGRRLWIPELKSPNAQVRAAAERAAINAPVQGSAADVIKRAMIAVDAWIKKEELQTRLILQVHDELVFEVPENEVERVKKAVPRLMAGVAHFEIPLLTQVGVASNWEAAH